MREREKSCRLASLSIDTPGTALLITIGSMGIHPRCSCRLLDP